MTITKSGELVSFYTVNKAPIKHLRVYFSPKQAGEGDPSPQNVRPIEGWDEVEVEQSGKNLYSIEKVRAHGHEDWDTIMSGNKAKVSVSNYNRWTFVDTAIPKAKYTYLPNCYEVGFLDADENVLDHYMGWSKYVITAPDNARYIYLSWYKNGTNTAEAALAIHNQMYLTFFDMIIEDSDYEPYHGHTYNLNWSNDIGTMYGGYVDLITGELQQEWAHVIIDENTLFYMATRQNNSGNYFYKEFNNEPDKQCLYTAGKLTESMRVEKSNQFEIQNSWGEASVNQFSTWAYANGDTKTTIRFGFPSELNITSVDAAKSWFTENGSLEIIYPLAAPIAHSLTSTQLQTLLGRNNIWSNADRVEIEYDLAESNDILYRRRNVLEKQYPHIITPAVNGLINFNTDMKAPLKQCKVYFNPIQEGEGDPSPENVRSISGWTGLEVYRTGKNLVDDSILQNATYNKWGWTNHLLPNTTYTWSAFGESDFRYGLQLGSQYVAAPQPNERLAYYISTGESREFTTPADMSEYPYLYVAGNASGAGLVNGLHFQLESGSIATTYEPYNNTTISIDWSSAGTVYGGYVDLVTGEVWETWGGVTLDGSQNAYISGSGYRGTNCTDVWFDAGSNRWGYNTSYTTMSLADSYCDSLKLTLKAIWGNPDLYSWAYTLNSYNQIHCVFDNGTVSITSDDTNAQAITKVKNWLTSHPITVKYRLNDSKATLITTLTPTVIKTLRGINNIWSNSNGNIELSYWTH